MASHKRIAIEVYQPHTGLLATSLLATSLLATSLPAIGLNYIVNYYVGSADRFALTEIVKHFDWMY